MTVSPARPLVSVIVPARDQARYVHDAMASLVHQLDDPRELEVIVIDDGSQDGTSDIVALFDDRLPVLRIGRNDAPRGPASARNQGLTMAQGRYIAFLDPDDWFAPGHLQALADQMSELGVDFVRTDHVRHVAGPDARGGEGAVTRKVHLAPSTTRGVALDPRAGIGPAGRTTMVDYCYPPFGMFDSSLRDDGLLYFLAGMHTAEDRPWIWRLHLHARSFAVVDSVGAFYRRGLSGSLTQVVDRRQLDFLAGFEDVFRMLRTGDGTERHWPKAVRQFFAIACHHLARTPAVRPDLMDELREGVALVALRAPDDVVRDTVAELTRTPERAGLLWSLPLGPELVTRGAPSVRARRATRLVRPGTSRAGVSA